MIVLIRIDNNMLSMHVQIMKEKENKRLKTSKGKNILIV